MSTRKTDDDIHREGVAREINAQLKGSGVSVAAGGKGGPFTVTVERVTDAELDNMVYEILKATGRLGRCVSGA